MADDFRALDNAELIEQREEEHFRRAGVPEASYPQMLAAAVAHAKAARAVPGPANTWYSIGPRNVGGRIIAIAQEPDSPLVLYAGSAHGGLWTTRDGGDTWSHIGDPDHSEPVGAIAIARQRPRTLYVGTGAHDPRHVSGSGLWKVDVAADPTTSVFTRLAGVDAAHVAPAAAVSGASFRYTRLRVDPDNPDRMWAATQTGLWRREPRSASFVRDFPPATGAPADTPPLATNDAGLMDVTWPPYCTDLLVARDPRDRARVTEAGVEGARYLLLFVAIHGRGVFRGQFDRQAGVVRWDAMRDVPNADLYVGGRDFGRIRLAQCASRPEVVYVVFSSQPGSRQAEHNHASFVFRSEDSGETWTRRGRIPRAHRFTDVPHPKDGQANYCMVLEVESHSPNVVVCGEIDVCLSTDGALTWTMILDSERYDRGDFAQHYDQHAVHFDETDGRRLWIGNDGGLSMARDLRQPPQSSGYWRTRSHGIVAAQFYDVTVHPTPALAFMCGGGLQDSGTYVGFGGRTWYRVGWGDGSAMAFHAASPDQFIVGANKMVSSNTIIDRPPAVDPAVDLTLGISSPVIPDVPAPNRELNLDWRPYPVENLKSDAFLALLEQDPTVPGQFLLGWWATPAGSLAFVVGPVGPLPAAPPPPPMTLAVASVVALLPALAQGTLAVPGGIDPGVVDQEEATAVALGPVEPAPEVGPVPPPAPPDIVQAWVGTSRGHLTHALNLANPGTFGTLGVTPHSMASIRRAISAIAVHPRDAYVVAVATVPRTLPFMVWITAAGATGTASFVVFQYPFDFPPPPLTPVTPPTGHVHGPFVTGPAVAIPATACTVGFVGSYVAGDHWEILPNGQAFKAPGTANDIAVVSSAAAAVTIVIVDPGTVGTATFHVGVGALAPDPAVAATLTAPRLDLQSSPLILFFSGTFVAGDRFTVTPQGAVTADAANSAAARLAARDGNRGHVLLSYDRGGTWRDVTAPAPPPRPDPDLDALPPGPAAALEWDRTTPSRLFAGTLVGVYALAGIPSPTGLTIVTKPATLPRGTAQRLVANLALTSGGPIDCTRACDWTSSNATAVTVSFDGRLTTVAAAALGAKSRIRARRGTLTDFFDVEVVADAVAAPPPNAIAFVPPNVTVAWRPFNRGLPLALVNDVTTVPGTQVLRAATFGRGIWDCNLAGDVAQRLYIRQTIVEDGRTYPRVVPQVSAGVPLNDPRLPQAGPSRIALDFTHAYDIRVDAAPFTFFDDVVDGVEFDEQLEVADPVPTEDNYVYVQVHNAGTTAVPNVSVHLYAAECDAADVINPIGAAATASPPSLDAGAPIADFYGRPGFDPIAASTWKRVDGVRLLDEVSPQGPSAARFTWAPAAELAGKHVALLALCSGHPLSLEELPGGPAAATLSAFILAERRAALRLVRVAPRPAASLYLRDGIADDTRVGGYPVGGRSPDIMVVHPDISTPAAEAFKDFAARRATDTVSSTVTNVIYVRVHNRRKFETNAKVKVYAIGLDDGNRPSRDRTSWKDLPPDPAFADVTVPPSGVGYARVELPSAADPNASGVNKTYLLLALVKAQDDTDPLPATERVNSVDDFWDLVSHDVDSDNAAARAVRWS